MLRAISLIAVIVLGLLTVACSTGPKAPEPGTPAFYWSAAKETYAGGDYIKTIEHLQRAAKTQNEFTVRAQVWTLVLTSGLAKGYLDLAESFEFGAKANRYKATAFRRQRNEDQRIGAQLALQFAESLMQFQKAPVEPKILLDFPMPTGTAIPPAQLTKIANGEVLQPAILDDVRRSALSTAVVLGVCRAAGAPDDTAKTQEVFKSGSAQVPRETFMLAMADALHTQSKLFSHDELDQPERLKLFLSQATDMLKVLPETKDTKALGAQIQKSLKQVSAK